MKKFFYLIFLTIMAVFLVSCDIDPYAGKRPIDYKNSYWLCKGDGYEIYFESGESEISQKNSIIKIGGKEIHFSFLWSAFDSKVTMYECDEYGIEGEILLRGICEFDKKKFEIKVNEKSNVLQLLPDILHFERINQPI